MTVEKWDWKMVEHLVSELVVAMDHKMVEKSDLLKVGKLEMHWVVVMVNWMADQMD